MRDRRDTLKNPEQELRIFRVRALLAVLVILLLTGLLSGRLVYLQVVQHEVYTTRSEKNRVRVEPLPPTRGLIFDRNGMLLAENRPTYNLTLIRERAENLDATLDRLEAKGLLTSRRIASATPTRRVFAVSRKGAEALAETRAMRERLWAGVDLRRLAAIAG